ncbi:MAG: hypothetical protein WC735_04615 [Candidatus Paceibacterota bacterium]|jgi:hypothetical protein
MSNDEQKPLLYIGPDGIKMNVNKDSSIETNSTKTFMKNVEQNVNGGKIKHYATEELTQICNKMEAKADGQIINEVGEGSLKQIGNSMKAEEGGKIINRIIKKDLKLPLLILTIGILADLTSLYFFGEHILEKLGIIIK